VPFTSLTFSYIRKIKALVFSILGENFFGDR
jgi:hypothetical protein